MARQGCSASSDNPAEEKAARAADCTRLADVEIQILELERSLASLKDEESFLRDRLATYTYPVLNLPNEIMSEIFIHFLPGFPNYLPPIGLLSPYLPCHICREWRDIVFATPALWTAILLSFHKVQNFPQKVGYLNASLGLSGSCLVSLKMETHLTDESKLARLAQTIIDNYSRWEYLEFPGTANFLPNPVKLLLPFLRGLRLGRFLTGLTASPLSVPSLQRLDLSFYHDHYSPIFAWSQLTVLAVGRVSLGAKAEAPGFQVPPAHVLCRPFVFGIAAFGPHASEAPEIQKLPSLRNVTLPHLETFLLDDWVLDDPMPSGILDRLTLPALQRLQIKVIFFAKEDDPIVSLASLVTRSKCNLRELSVSGLGIVHQKYLDAFPLTAVVFYNELAVTEPFLGLLSGGEDGESPEFEQSDSEEEYEEYETDTDLDSSEGEDDADIASLD
ncbi:hypothetical protein DFH08DRAFT_934268 [Mycena albidolilacea]|uniref:F-box domain-containing protein n=1 Tax=Mycena albidolilacea TaxID=1033008 RepID=A0AAD7AA65_9AGAR|nr:hypothetical protein DFH08DRAFT_934268 [Mycena albidolilacea]